ncbi:LuxR C-terminal-related transcriptional regulator [Streptomyces sp. NBC_00289]|uniref:helix-turn-helix transcriptional regulator n=1 Tax=Streptomyces sp. NBC_00289 TaxID=2975703 RepID=UPI0032505F1A
MRVEDARWPLVGREEELKAFSLAFAGRKGRGWVIHGPAGVGKSRLAEESLTIARQAGYRTGRATATAAASTVPLGAIAHLIPAGVDLSDPAKGFQTAAAALTGPQRRRWAFLVDDVHLLDATSAMLLQQLMDAGVVRLIATIRSGERVNDAVAALRDSAELQQVGLAELNQSQVERLLQTVLDGPVGRLTLYRLHISSGGNMLYLRELVLAALAAGTLTNRGGVWELAEPSLLTVRLTELIGERLASAGETGRAVLEILALCEPLSITEAIQAASLEVVTDLERAGLIRIGHDRRRSAVTLTHPLYGEVLRTQLPTLNRRAVLLAQAERIEACGARRRGDALHIATWRLAATGTADPALLAQGATLARHAHDYPQVIALLKALPDLHQTFSTRLLLGESLLELGMWEQAEAVLIKADKQASTEQEKLAATFIRTNNLFWTGARTADALAVNDAARAYIADPVGRYMLQVNEACIRTVSGQPLIGVELLKDLEHDVREAPDVNTWLQGTMMKSAGLAMRGRAREAAALAERGYAVHVQIDRQALIAHPASQLNSLVMALTEAGELTEARKIGEGAFADLLAARATLPRVWVAFHMGRAEWLAGHPAGARRWYAEAAVLAQNHGTALHPVLAGLGASAALCGDLEAAQEALSALEDHQPMGILTGEEQLCEAWILVAQGRVAQARDRLTSAAGAARGSGHITSEALLLTDIARLGGAKDVVERLAELAQQSEGALAVARSHLAAALAADDPEGLMAVSAELETMGVDLLAAEAASAAAVAWRRTGHNRRATPAAQQAATLTAHCEGARTPLLVTAESAATLTAREREIALLAATGTVSKDIAETLGLSVRTVDNHLHHAYSKLGVTTRRQLADTLGVTARISSRSGTSSP